MARNFSWRNSPRGTRGGGTATADSAGSTDSAGGVPSAAGGAARPSLGRSLRAVARRLFGQEVQGALVLCLLLGVFFWTPLSRYGEVHYTSADLTQDFLLTKLIPDHEPGNRLLSDAVTQMQPWLIYSRDELRAKRFPLWNPLNGTGAPHLANYQSAVLSPFSFPFYVLSFRAALLLSAFLELFSLGFLTFLFLKQIGLRQVAALVGGTAFMFCGHNVLLLSFPHVGSLVALPGGLLFAEMAIRRFERASACGARPRLFWPLAGLALSLTVGLLAGNPEPFYFAALLVAAYVGARLAVLFVAARRGGRSLAPPARLMGQLALAALVGGALAAPQVLPFLEYLQHSRLYLDRLGIQTPLDASLWALAFFPDVLGNPSSLYILSYEVPPPNYELVNMSYVGATALLVAGLSICFVRQDRRVLFFLGVAGIWIVYAYDLFGSWRWFALIPTLGIAPMNRSQGIFAFCVAVLAALAVHHLLTRPPRRALLLGMGTAFGAGVLLAGFLYGANLQIERHAHDLSLNHSKYLHYVPDHLLTFSQLYLLGAGAAAFLWISRGNGLRNVLALVVLVSLFLQTGHHHRDYNPVTEDALCYPLTPAMATLQDHVGRDQLAILGEEQIPPASNLPYQLSTIANYDGLWVRDYDQLYRDAFGDSNNWRPILRASERMLQVFGVQYVLAKWGWLDIDTGLSHVVREDGTGFVRQPILSSPELSQTFRSTKPGLSTVTLRLTATPFQGECHARFQLFREDTGALVHERTFTSDEVRATTYSRRHIVFESEPRLGVPSRPFVFEFEPQPDSEGALYRFVLGVPEGLVNGSIVTWSTDARAYEEGLAYRGDEPLSGELLFDFRHDSSFEPVAEVAEFTLYRFGDALGKYQVVGGALIAESNASALDYLRSPSFDPRNVVVLSAESLPPSSETLRRVRDNSGARLLKREDSVRVYLLTEDETTLVHVEDEITFMANHFKWDQIETVSAEEFARYRIIEDDIDAARAAGLRVIAPEEIASSRPEVLLETPNRTRLAIERQQPGYLVVAKAHYPGWKARVNGEPSPLLRANYAFDAVALERGRNEVELYYAPDSLRYGLYIALAGLLAAAGAFVVSQRGEPGGRAWRLMLAPRRRSPRDP